MKLLRTLAVVVDFLTAEKARVEADGQAGGTRRCGVEEFAHCRRGSSQASELSEV